MKRLSPENHIYYMLFLPETASFFFVCQCTHVEVIVVEVALVPRDPKLSQAGNKQDGVGEAIEAAWNLQYPGQAHPCVPAYLTYTWQRSASA